MALQKSSIVSFILRCLSLVDENSKPLSLSPFLTLPPEIRDLIYATVLTSSFQRPQNPTDKNKRQRLNILKYATVRPSKPTTWWLKKAVPYSAGSLLLTCRQIRHEVIGLLSRFEKNRYQNSRYEFSITILEADISYPTWLLVPPVLSDFASLVWIDIYTPGMSPGKLHKSGRCMAHRGSTSVWDLFAILNRFLLYGPAFSAVDASPLSSEMVPAQHSAYVRPRSCPIQKLKLLVLSVLSPTKAEMEGKPFLSGNESPSNYCYSDVRCEMHPEWFIKRLEECILLLIKRGVRAGMPIIERVEIIRLCLDGEERCSLDVGDLSRQNPLN